MTDLFNIIKVLYQDNDKIAQFLSTYETKKALAYHKNNFEATNQYSESICWAHAIATVVHLTLSGIVGRDIPPFMDIREELCDIFGRNVQNVKKVLDKVLDKKYKLKKIDEANEDQAKNAISNMQFSVAVFYLTALQWVNFIEFFQNNKNGILTSEIINKERKIDERCRDGSHAVVFLGFNDDHLLFLNSWGKDWGDDGKFRIKDSSVLNKIDYYIIYWTDDQLTPTEKGIWQNKKTGYLIDFVLRYFRISPEAKMKCPHCSIIKETIEFLKNIQNSTVCICPECNAKFHPNLFNLSHYNITL